MTTLTDAERAALHWLAIQCCSQDRQVSELATCVLAMIRERQDALDRLTSPAATPEQEERELRAYRDLTEGITSPAPEYSTERIGRRHDRA